MGRHPLFGPLGGIHAFFVCPIALKLLGIGVLQTKVLKIGVKAPILGVKGPVFNPKTSNFDVKELNFEIKDTVKTILYFFKIEIIDNINF